MWSLPWTVTTALQKKRLLIHRLATKRVSKYFSKIKLLQFKIMILSQKHFNFNKVIAICPKIFRPYCMFYCKIFACGHFLRQSLQLYRKKRLLIHRLATKRVSKYFSKIKLLQFKIMILSQKHFSFNSICKKWVIKAAWFLSWIVLFL